VSGGLAGAAARRAAAMLMLAVSTTGLPLLLWRLAGTPIPSRLPSAHEIWFTLLHRDDGSLFIAAVRDASWLGWAAFALAVLAEAQAAIRGRPAPRLHLLGLQGAAARLVAAASVTFTTPAVVTLATAPAAIAAPAAAAAQAAPAAVRHLDARSIVVVRPGDCLWTIAERYLGAGDRYPELVALNLGHEMGDGQVFTDPSLILPGWRLQLPRGTVPSGRGSHRHQRHQSAHPHHAHPSGDRLFGEPHQSAGAGDRQSQGTASASGSQDAGSGNRPGELADGQREEVKQAVLFTLGMLAGAALVILERLRHRQRQHRRLGRRIALPTDTEAKRIEQKLRAARAFAPPESLRDALCDLSEGVARGGHPLPPIVGIHLTAGRIDVLLSAPAVGPPPAPFTIAPGRHEMCWTADLREASPEWTTAPLVPGEVGDLLPGLFTAGMFEDGGNLLLDLEAMRVTCCDGPGSLIDRLLVTAATELASSRWSGWYDLLLVGCDELDVIGRAEHCRSLDQALDALEARMLTIARRLADDPKADVRTRRMEDPEDEDWGLMLLVSRLEPTPEQMARLLVLADGPGGVAALVAGDIQATNGKLAPALLGLEPDPEGRGQMLATVTLACLGPQHELTVWPQTLTVDEYEALAGLFTTASATSDVSQEAEPYDDYGGPPWMRFAAAPVLADADELARAIGFPEPAEAGDTQSGPALGQGELAEERPQQSRHGGAGTPDEASQQWRAEPTTGVGRWTPSLRVNVLGRFEVAGSAESLQPKQAELVLALALHSPVGVSNSALCGLLGADADHPRPADSVRQLITRTRRRLGLAADGREYIIHLGSGIYALHESVRLDWADFSALAMRGRAGRAAADLRAALELVRGQPFAECYYWWIDIALVETMRAEIVDTADLLAQLELADRDPLAAARAARKGLSAETAAEQLWRALMRAEHEAGNPRGVADAWTRCLDAINELAPDGDPHPETERLFRQLSQGGDKLSGDSGSGLYP
jgi:DNA-binding SARP family transcriptional activator